jgi:hypothetical protein
MTHEEQKIATIVSLQQARKVAMKDIEFYLRDLNSEVNATFKNFDEIKKAISIASQIKQTLDLSVQLYIMSNLLEVYFSQNTDDDYIMYLEDNMTKYIKMCNDYILHNFSKLEGIVSAYKPKTLEKVNKNYYNKKISAITASLKNGNESKDIKMIHSVLHAASQSAEYYLTKDGNVYLKAQ